jgi:signal transduction histidine kinase
MMGWFITRRAMSGVERVTKTAMFIGKDHLGERVNIGHEGLEIEDLAIAFNGMIERIDSLVTGLRDVTDNLAHDLRSPITRLRGTAETTLAAKSSIQDYREFAAAVIEDADALIHLLNTILEIAKTDSGMARFVKEPVNVAELVRNTHELFLPAVEDQGLRFEIDIEPGELIIKGDVARLQRVMANLLDNAIKHTPRGGMIRVVAAKSSDHVAISVMDTGEGIDAKDMPRIFERFYRGDASRSKPGSGLGLSLCQAIVRAHGGEINVTSTPGKGSTFTVRLPV